MIVVKKNSNKKNIELQEEIEQGHQATSMEHVPYKTMRILGPKFLHGYTSTATCESKNKN